MFFKMDANFKTSVQARKLSGSIDGRKVGHFLITIQKSFKLIINQS